MWFHWAEVEEENQEHWVHLLNAAQYVVEDLCGTAVWKTVFLFLKKL